MKKTRVVANWQPSKFDYDTIRKEWKELYVSLGIEVTSPSLDFRDPFYRPDLHPAITQWHQDNDGADFTMLLWSNVTPTEVKFKEVKHRMPPGAYDKDAPERWFIRF